MDPNSFPVTWVQLGVFATILTIILGAIVGLLFKFFSSWVKELKGEITASREEVDALAKCLEENRLETTRRLDDVRLEMARNYATMETVAQVETRLTATVNRMSDTIGASLHHLTTRIESMFGQIIQNAAK